MPRLPRFGELWNILEQSHRNDLVSVQLSNEQRTPSCLEYIGDYTTQLNGEFFFFFFGSIFFYQTNDVSFCDFFLTNPIGILVGFWGAWPWGLIPTWFLREAPSVASPSGQCLDGRDFWSVASYFVKRHGLPIPSMYGIFTYNLGSFGGKCSFININICHTVPGCYGYGRFWFRATNPLPFGFTEPYIWPLWSACIFKPALALDSLDGLGFSNPIFSNDKLLGGSSQDGRKWLTTMVIVCPHN